MIHLQAQIVKTFTSSHACGAIYEKKRDEKCGISRAAGISCASIDSGCRLEMQSKFTFPPRCANMKHDGLWTHPFELLREGFSVHRTYLYQVVAREDKRVRWVSMYKIHFTGAKSAMASRRAVQEGPLLSHDCQTCCTKRMHFDSDGRDAVFWTNIRMDSVVDSKSAHASRNNHRTHELHSSERLLLGMLMVANTR